MNRRMEASSQPLHTFILHSEEGLIIIHRCVKYCTYSIYTVYIYRVLYVFVIIVYLYVMDYYRNKAC